MFNYVQKSTQNEQKPLMEDVGPRNSKNKTKRKIFQDIYQNKDFLCKILTVIETITRADKRDCIKIESFCTAKENLLPPLARAV